MGSMLLNIGCATAAWALSACVVAAAAQSERAAFVKFKGGMMPKIGQKITVLGILSKGNKVFVSPSTIGVRMGMQPRNQASQRKTTSTLTFAEA